MADPKGMFIWYELFTPDADAAQQFYCDVLGWTVSDSGMPNMDYRTLNAGEDSVGGLLQLTDEMTAGGFRPMWLGYIAVDDIERAVADAGADGASVHVPPTEIPNVGRFAMLADPQGAMFYFIQTTNSEPSFAFRGDVVGHCAWNELSTTDASAALAFYEKHAGFEPGETMAMGPMGDYLMFDVAGTTIGGMMRDSGDGPPPMWRFYFRVPDLVEAIGKVNAGGGQVVHGPQPVPGDDHIVIGIDPQGAMFALVARA